MEPAGQAVYFGLFGSVAAGKGLLFANCSTSATFHPGFIRAKFGKSKSWWPDQPWPPWTPVCGSQQTSQHQSWCKDVGGLIFVIYNISFILSHYSPWQIIAHNLGHWYFMWFYCLFQTLINRFSSKSKRKSTKYEIKKKRTMTFSC